MKLGDKIKVRVDWTDEEQVGRNRRSVKRDYAEGYIIYIHPKAHFYRAEFKLLGGVIRESFLFSE